MTSPTHDLAPGQHRHAVDSGKRRGASRTRWVLAPTSTSALPNREMNREMAPEMDRPLTATLRQALASDGDAQLADHPLGPSDHRQRLAPHAERVRRSVAVHRCPGRQA